MSAMQTSMNQHQDAAAIVAALKDHLPALECALDTTNAVEHAFNTTPPVREGFVDQDAAEDGLASLRYFLEEAVKQVRRVERARETPKGGVHS